MQRASGGGMIADTMCCMTVMRAMLLRLAVLCTAVAALCAAALYVVMLHAATLCVAALHVVVLEQCCGVWWHSMQHYF